MGGGTAYRWLADAVLALHAGVVAFVVFGLAAVFVGNLRGWRWANAPGFRLAHLAAVLFVVAETWAGAVCPLTTLEMRLRAKAGLPTYGEGFVEHWLRWLIYYDAPAWAFTLAYTAFGLLVAAAWVRYPPAFRRRGKPTSGNNGSPE